VVYVQGSDFFILILYGFEGIFDCGTCRKKNRYMSEMCVNILCFISCTHSMNSSSSARFKFVGYYTVDPHW
jgi:hypothetical protein